MHTRVHPWAIVATVVALLSVLLTSGSVAHLAIVFLGLVSGVLMASPVIYFLKVRHAANTSGRRITEEARIDPVFHTLLPLMSVAAAALGFFLVRMFFVSADSMAPWVAPAMAAAAGPPAIVGGALVGAFIAIRAFSPDRRHALVDST